MRFNQGNVHESVTENEDGSYTIFIDTDICVEAQRESFYHAIKHIIGGDFSKDDVQLIEYTAH